MLGLKLKLGFMSGSAMPALMLNFISTATLDPRITFSRGTNGMVTDATGKLTYAPNNLLLDSESFEASSWNKTANATVTANQAASPNGTTTADLYAGTAAGGNGLYRATAGLTANASYTFSIYAKYVSGTWFEFLYYDGSTNQVRIWVNLSTGTAGSAGAAGTATITASSVTSVGDGWYRISLTGTQPGTTGYVQINSVSANGTETASAGSAYLWGAQLEAVTYQTTPSTYNSTTPKNLLGYTQEFDNAAWTKSGATVTANDTTSPDGTATAERVTANSGAGPKNFNQVGKTLSAGPATWSVYAKYSNNQWISINAYDGSTVDTYFDIQNGVVGIVGSGATATIISVGGGWYRCTVTRTAASTANAGIGVALVPSNGVINFPSATGTEAAYFWGAQLSNSASVDPYVYNPGAAPTSAAYYGPRFDYDPTTLAAKGLLIEEARSNLCVYSQTPSDANWSATSSAKTSTNNSDPFGTSTALLLTADGLSGTHYVSAGTVSGPSYTSGTTYTISCFVKAGTTNLVQLTAAGAAFGSVQYANFSLTGAGSVTASAVGTAAIAAYSGGWYRVSLTVPATATASASAGNIVFITAGTDGRVPTNTSSGTLYVAGWQAEAGSFATSYIPTGASTVTRSADVALMQGANFSQWYNQSEGTFVAQFDMIGGSAANTNNQIVLSPIADASNRHIIYNGDAEIAGYTVVGGVTQAYLPMGSLAANTTSKMAYAYQVNNFAASQNGGAVSTDTSGSLPVPTLLGIGSGGLGGNYLNGHIRSISYYNTRLPDTTLRSYST